MQAGTVCWFDDVRGYGFIGPDDGSKDIFVHANDVQAAGLAGLTTGQRVEFERAVIGGRPRAAELRLVGEKARMKP
jgi:cold shock CspA family protein